MKSAVIVFPGSNCDRDMAEALRLVTGRAPAMVWHREDALPAGLDLIAIPGGFSYGDYLRSGAMAAQSPVMWRGQGGGGARRRRARRLQRLPGADRGAAAARRADAQCRHPLRLPRRAADRSRTASRPSPPATRRARRSSSRSPIMTAITRPTQRRSTGSRARAASPSAMPATSTARRGSIAGILNEAGNVLGMMPHPERAVEAAHGRDRRPAAVRGPAGDGRASPPESSGT